MIKQALVTLITWGILLAWGSYLVNEMTMKVVIENVRVTVGTDYGRALEIKTK